MTYADAILYILDQAGPHGLVHECLKEFVDEVELRIGLQEHNPINYAYLADCALLEWDI